MQSKQKKLKPGLKEVSKDKAWQEFHSGKPLTRKMIEDYFYSILKDRPKDRVTKITQFTATEIKKFPTLEDVQATEWYQTRPEIIKNAIDLYPPTQYYKFKDSGKQCYIHSYSEVGHDESIMDNTPKSRVTLTVHKTGQGGPMASMGLGALDTNSVFGVPLDSIEPWTN